MKSIGIVRQVDELGRIVIPIELRRVMGMNEGDPVEFFIDDQANRLMFRKYQSGCLFCDSMESISYFRGRQVCSSCLRDMAPQPDVDSMAVLESETALESGEQSEKGKMGGKGANALRRLAEVMQTYPNATQGEWASQLGISQGYVSQLIRKLDKKA
ncbi:AbrB/MazE/SpoVT family DNA-binding domain-containing protein [Paenibacillus lautus]|uniref:AbrB/MazE/SpoVT family DNA-binding domain-containing protein n=1 Tax=Paenibacillus lautus TaxID=1401 RepID=UPI002DB659E3|nr:AbrB/MazE/SpoVT family DNA-binding domain-containing protein [Paenibacillus lautus]MEC0259349.1 AbrB/MazE/SpoVT family DNA-binding domain-containing protein [Paenibacillus lautus]